MIEFILTEQPEEDSDPLPSYSDPGWLLVRVDPPSGTVYRWDVEAIAYDSSSSVFWITEGEGFDYWVENVSEIERPGVYMITGIVGHYHRGDGWATDDDVEWEIGECRLATAAEMAEYDDGSVTGSVTSGGQEIG